MITSSRKSQVEPSPRCRHGGARRRQIGRELVKHETDILVRINELRMALRDIKSEDVREAIEAAIGDCERQLGINRTDRGEQSPGFAT